MMKTMSRMLEEIRQQPEALARALSSELRRVMCACCPITE
jgi:hypothetical protein